MSRDHGTKACYVYGPEGGDTSRGCRCEACLQASREEKNQRSRLVAYGRWQPYVDAGPAREHLKMLMENGIGWKRAAVLAGVPNGAVTQLLYGGSGNRPPSRRIRPATEAAILAVRPSLDLMADLAGTDATGTRRRVQALAVTGWSQAELGARLRMKPGTFSAAVRRDRVSAAFARAVRDLCRELWDQPPPEATPQEKRAAARTRGHAAKSEWVPLAAWDDIDDPQARPAEGWQRAPEDARRPAALLVDEARELFSFGLDRNQAAERLEVTRNRLDAAFSRAARAEAAAPAAAGEQEAAA